MKTVLVADDSKTSQMMVQGALGRVPDVRCVCAGNGREALDLIERSEVHLLISDVNMPEMDGIELVRHVRRTRSSQQLPIILLTAKADREAQGEGIALGANACVLKPLSRQELSDLVSALLAS